MAADDNSRWHRTTFRWSREQHARWAAAAERAGCSLSAWVTRACDAQLTKGAGQGMVVQVPDELMDELREAAAADLRSVEHYLLAAALREARQRGQS